MAKLRTAMPGLGAHGGYRRRDRLTSWPVVLLLAAAALAVGVVGVRGVQQSINARMLADVERDARLIRSLLVRPNVTSENVASRSVSPITKIKLDDGVARLRQRHNLTGLEVWSLADGGLIYADPGHPADEDTMPAEELARAHLGASFTQVSPATDDRGVESVDVFVQFDVDDDGRSEAVVEVLLSREPLDAAITRSTNVLFGGAGAFGILATAALWTFRRRRSSRYTAHHDSLTGLGNRALLATRTDRALAAARPEHGPAVLLFDLDGFKEINDTLGHDAGDDLLVAVAERLVTGCRDGDTVVRLGGDEFGILLAPAATRADAIAFAHRHLDSLRRPVLVSGLSVEVGASIGIALAPEHGTDVNALLRCADVAMYEAKRTGAGVTVYEPQTDCREARQLTVLAELRRGIADGELRLHYQPKASIDGRITEVEALVRWQHPQHGLLPPDRFVPLAERTSLIRPLTDWVLDEATRQCARWRAAGYPLGVAVNISPRSLTDDLPPVVAAAAAQAGLPLSALELEITETAVMADPDRAVAVLTRLREMGVSTSIDDFGVGYTSLSYLTTLPVETLKIDKRFVANMLDKQADEAVVRSVIQLAHGLGMGSLAEGVESHEVWRRLAELGCDHIQGYVLSRPLPAAEFIEWMDHARPAPVLVGNA